MMTSKIARRRGLRRGALLATMALTGLAVMGGSSALATPSGEWAVFAQCPLSNASLSGCIAASTTSGEFTVGAKTVPIKHTITLQGGFIENEETGALSFVGAANGETLSKTAQTVPGGLVGIAGLGGEVTATTELALPASSIGLNEANLLGETGVALELPVKVKLGNPFLGGNCYVGSKSHPIFIKLTTGTTSPPKPNKAIKGALGELSVSGEGSILNIAKNSLVDNAFAVSTGAEGCGLIPFLTDPLVNLVMGVPSAAGHNTAILNGTLHQTGAASVREH
jgi:hypothetical protein